MLKKKYSKKAIEALWESIEHYDRLIAGEDRSIDGVVCACCRYFECCVNCMIFHFTGKKHCEGTVWEKLSSHICNVHEHFLIVQEHCETCEEFLHDEQDFLFSLYCLITGE